MAGWTRCSTPQLAIHAVQLSLLVVWLVLTGIKIAHFLSQPTALQFRLDTEFQPPFVTVFPGSMEAFPDCSDEEVEEIEEGEYYEDSDHDSEVSPGPSNSSDVLGSSRPPQNSSQSLKEFLLSNSDPWMKSVLNANDLCSRKNSDKTRKTMSSWPVVNSDGVVGVTMAPCGLSGFRLNLTLDPLTVRQGEETPTIYYNVILHGERDFFRYDPGIHAILAVENRRYRDMKITVDRDEKLNLKRQPCDPDPGLQYRSVRAPMFHAMDEVQHGGWSERNAALHGTALQHAFETVPCDRLQLPKTLCAGQDHLQDLS